MFRWFVITLSVLLTSVGQLFLKRMLLLGEARPRLPLWKLTLLALLQPQVLLGFLSFGAGAVLWLAVLAREELSYAYPLSALGYLVILFASHWLFSEPLSPSRLIGVLFIVAGVCFIEYSR